jgi:pseudouridine-5'-phosphate glycosidase
MKPTNSSLIISEEVSDALAHGRPVVALETALVTHGMPPPINLQTALSCESRVRESGAVPATIGSKSLPQSLLHLPDIEPD